MNTWKANLKIVEDVCAKLIGCRNKILISATNPVDVFNYVAWKILKWDRKHMIGFCLNDTVRMQWALSETTGICCSRIGAVCIGEHGDGQVPLFDRVTADGEALFLTDRQREDAFDLVGNWFARYQGLKSGRTSGWTSAVGLTRLIRAVASPTDDVLPCSAVLNGEYGQEGLSIGVPCRLGAGGIEEIIDLSLSENELVSFASAARKIKSLIAEVGY
jgi:malate dehydrogenase